MKALEIWRWCYLAPKSTGIFPGAATEKENTLNKPVTERDSW